MSNQADRSLLSLTFKFLKVIALSFLLAGQGYFLVPASPSHCDCVPIAEICPCVQAHGACDCEAETGARSEPIANRSLTQNSSAKSVRWLCVSSGLSQTARCLQLQSQEFSPARQLGNISHRQPTTRWIEPIWRPPASLRAPPSALRVV